MTWFTSRELSVSYAAFVSHLLELFYSEHCFSCPEARQALRQFATSRSDVIVVERDVATEKELELARRYRLIATPAIVIDGHEVMYGVPGATALAARVDASQPVTHLTGCD